MNHAAIVRGVRLSDAVALAVILGLFAVSVALYETVPAEMLVHYTPPGGVYYGVETLPKRVGLFLVPVFTLLTYVVGRVVPVVTGAWDEFGVLAPYYDAALAGLVVLFGAVHTALLLLNV